MPDVNITQRNGRISVDNPKVQVWVSKKDTVKFRCSQGNFNIEFKTGSNHDNPSTNQEGDNQWGAEVGPFTTPGKLFYSVKADGHDTLDPEIEIFP